ncbi:MAG: GDP-mannose 4,6-dehydratase [Ruminococcaceae bacterium]|nr:GDP-mannose 4,6-dehydratase [Oscillospiraceae bacterium]
MKNALITGITGQDGSYLAELLLEKGYNVYGLVRRKSRLDFGNLEGTAAKEKIHFIFGDITDMAAMLNAVRESQPDEVYNLAAQSFVAQSFKEPAASANITGIAAVNILEALRTLKPDAKYYQASTSEMFGGCIDEQGEDFDGYTEKSFFHPRSPYGVAKLFAHWTTRNYRESYGMFACSGILFNHESERRGLEFVTRKITHAAARIKLGMQEYLELGNMDAKRDWGHSRDYVQAMWLMLQQDKPEDYVIASHETHTVREFVELSFAALGMDIKWSGEGTDEIGIDAATGKTVVKINPVFYRPAEVDLLLGNPEKAETELKWVREVSFRELVERMVKNDLAIAEKELAQKG